MPPSRHSKRENDTDSGRFHHRAECVIVVDAVTLLKPLGDETSFETFNDAVDVVLDLEHPPAIDEIDTRGAGTSRQVELRCSAEKDAIVRQQPTWAHDRPGERRCR